MLISSCPHCGSGKLYIQEKKTNTGLYCDDCGKWIKWLSKEDIKVFERTKAEMERLEKEQKDIFTPHDLETMTRRLEELVKAIDKEVDDRMGALPVSIEDSLSKSSYCMAMDKVKYAIQNILEGKDFYD